MTTPLPIKDALDAEFTAALREFNDAERRNMSTDRDDRPLPENVFREREHRLMAAHVAKDMLAGFDPSRTDADIAAAEKKLEEAEESLARQESAARASYRELLAVKLLKRLSSAT